MTVLDSFTRALHEEANDAYTEYSLGVTDLGLTWVNGPDASYNSIESSGTGATATAEIDTGAFHVFGVGDNFVTASNYIRMVDELGDGSIDMTWQAKWDDMSSGTGDWTTRWRLTGPPASEIGTMDSQLAIAPESIGSSTIKLLLSNSGLGGASASDSITISLAFGTWYNVHYQRIEGDVLRAKFWLDGDPEPGSWTLSIDISGGAAWPTSFPAYGPSFSMEPQSFDGTPLGIWVDNIALAGTAASGYYLRVYDPDDTFLVTLTEAKDIAIRREHNNVGTGKFSINRHSADATAAVLTPGNYVRVVIPQIDPDPIFGFFLEAGDFNLVSSDEQGGEDLTFTGRGSLSYWDRAIWLAQSFFTPWWPTYLTVPPATPPSTAIGALAFPKGWYYHWGVSGTTATTRTKFYTNGFTAYYNTRKRYTRSGLPTLTLCHLSSGVYSGYYVNPFTPKVRDYRKKNPYTLGPSVLMSSISTAKRPGEILYAMYAESQSADRPDAPLPAMTIDFTDTLDSDGNAWTVTDALNGVSSELGDDYLSTIGKLVNTGSVDVVMGPDLDMHAYNAYGRDLHHSTFASGKVRFAKGVNIADELTREYTDQPVGTFAEVIGNEEGAIARVFLPSPGSRPAREISVRGDTADTDALEALGLSELATRLLHSDAIGFAVATPISGAENDLTGLYLPGPPGSANGNYWVGDLVTLHTGSGEHDFDEETVRVAAITITFSESDDLRVVVEVGSGFGGMPQISASSSASTGPTSGTPVSSLSDLYQLISERDQPGGYPSLDDDGLLDPSVLSIEWKQSVRVATTTPGALTTSFEAGDVIDGITLVEGDDILIKDQAAAATNGIYNVEASGAPSRRSDMDADVEVAGTVVLVREGTANGGTIWRATNATDPVIDTDAITFAKVVSSTSTTSAGRGEILIADVHSTPLVFGDLIQTEAGDDLVYADV